MKEATEYANNIVQEAIDFSYSTDWLEKHVPKLIKILELNPLLTIPISGTQNQIWSFYEPKRYFKTS